VFGIESTNIDEFFTLSLTNNSDPTEVESLNYSVFCYLKNRVLDSYTESLTLRNVCRALYAYSVAADAYFA